MPNIEDSIKEYLKENIRTISDFPNQVFNLKI